MPRIDPQQLLSCLSVLLSPTGGIKSKEEVQRLAGLMYKFSKKLVSKCIYVHILKNTSTDLIGMFMGVGGWNLTNSWLSDAVEARNWPLIQELLELLLMCPVDVERLKQNGCPKLVKGLSKDTTNKNVQVLASKLVDQWLQIVKGSGVPSTTPAAAVSPAAQPTTLPATGQQTASMEVAANGPVDSTLPVDEEVEDEEEEDEEEERAVCIENGNNATGGLVYKITIKDGKQVVAKVADKTSKRPSLEETSSDVKDGSEVKPPAKRKLKEEHEEEEEVKRAKSDTKVKSKPKVDKSGSLEKKSSRDSSKKSSSSSSSRSEVKSDSKSSSRTSDKKHSSSSSRNGHSDRSRSDKDRSKDGERDRYKSSSKDKSKEKSSKASEKENSQVEKDKAVLAKLVAPSLSKVGKIPKKSDAAKNEEGKAEAKSESKSETKSSRPIHPAIVPEVKKKSISIENRRLLAEGRPKTVKIFNSKFRSTGLEEEVKPPPPRAAVKKANVPPVAVVAPSVMAEKKEHLKRSSPPSPELSSAEKKPKPAETTSPVSANKLADKPKRGSGSSSHILMDSDFFMDALTAANSKKEPKKRKRRASNSRDEPPPKGSIKADPDGHGSPASSPGGDSDHAQEPTTPIVEKPVFKFYQETLQLNDDENKETPEDKKPIKEEEEESKKNVEETGDRTPTPIPDEDESTAAEAAAAAAAAAEEENRRAEEDRQARERESKRIPKGVLVFHRGVRTAKKNVRWKGEAELESVQFFELDETERVNVTKTFMDMKQMERINERETLARRLVGEDLMKEQTMWTHPIPVTLEPSEIIPGFKSREKDVQKARELNVPPATYPYGMVPDSAAEPDVEHHPVEDPLPIPLDDVTGNPASINDFTNTPWPDPKPMLLPPSMPEPLIMHGDGFHPLMGGPGVPMGPGGPMGPGMMPFQGMPGQRHMGMGPGPGPDGFHPGMQGHMDPSMMAMGPGTGMTGGDWRTGDGKVVMPDIGGMPGIPGMQPMPGGPMDMYHQGGMDGGWGGPDMNYGHMGPGPNMGGPNMGGPNMGGPNMGGPNMGGPNMGGPNMGGPFGMQQGFGPMMGGGGPGGPGGPNGPNGPGGPGFIRGGGRGRGWFRGGGGSGGGGGGGGGGSGSGGVGGGNGGGDSWRGSRGRGGWSGQKRPTPVCHYFRKGNCHTPNCQFQHPADLKRHGNR